MSDFQVGDKVVVVAGPPEYMSRLDGQTATVTDIYPELGVIEVELIPEDGPQTDHTVYGFDYEEIEKVAP